MHRGDARRWTPLHAVHLFSTAADETRLVTEFLGETLGRGGSAVVVAGPAVREAVDGAVSDDERSRLIMVDERDGLARFARGGLNEAAFGSFASAALLDAAGRGNGEVAAYGTMVARLVEDGRPDDAVELEEMWNRLPMRFRLLCGYHAGLFAGSAGAYAPRVCETHTHVERSVGPLARAGVPVLA